MSVEESIYKALMVYGIAVLIAMLVGLLIKITYAVVHWSSGKAKRS